MLFHDAIIAKSPEHVKHFFQDNLSIVDAAAQNVYVAMGCKPLALEASRASATNGVERLKQLEELKRQFTQDLTKWAETGGELLANEGWEWCLCVALPMIPAVKGLQEQFQQRSGAPICAGMGFQLDQALRALTAAQEGSILSLFYTPEVDQALERSSDGSGASLPASASSSAESQLFKALEASEPAPTLEGPGEMEQQVQKIAGDLQKLLAQVKAGIVQLPQDALQSIAALAATLSSMVHESTEPDPSQAVPSDPNVLNKDQGVAKHRSEEAKLGTGVDLPAGSRWGDKVKVRHGDGSTSWVSLRSGMVRAQDETGHPVSARHQDAK